MLYNFVLISRRLILNKLIGRKCGAGYRANPNLKQRNQCSTMSSTYSGSDQRRDDRNNNNRKIDFRCFFLAAPVFVEAFKKTETEDDVVKTWLDKLIPNFRFIFEKEDDSPEGQLVMTVKRAIVCIQREQYKKAEQMIHLALRMAQTMQHDDGITMCFDIMANLAYETEQFEKADKLFVAVLQRLLEKGVKQNDIKVFERNETTDFLLNNFVCYSSRAAGAAHKFENCTNRQASITGRKGGTRLSVDTGGIAKRSEKQQRRSRYI